MSGKSFVYNNNYVRKINGLYLDSRTSDVEFVFDIDTDHPVKVPAHKAILSLDNPVFDAMFYGSIKEKGDIPISDASAVAFKEFLQFFYLDQVRLTSQNIVQVINLCKKYEMNEFLMECEKTLKKSLTLNDMCVGYSIALLLEQKNLLEFCGQQIKKNPKEVIKSESFLECGRNLLEKILTLVSSDWNASDKVIANMEWAKAECKRNNLDASPENLRNQLGDLFNRIPFEKLTLEQFNQHFITYTGLFNVVEIAEISQKILLQNDLLKKNYTKILPSKQLNPVLSMTSSSSVHILDCDRSIYNGYKTLVDFRNETSSTEFTSNTNLLLTSFYLPTDFIEDKKGDRISYSIYEKGTVFSVNVSYIYERIELFEPVAIKAGIEYSIRITSIPNCVFGVPQFRNFVDLEQDIEIRFVNRFGRDLISRLIFKIPKN